MLFLRRPPPMTDFADRIYVDVDDSESGARLIRRLERTRTAALLGVPACLVVATFGPAPSDLAELLREIETWVETESLCAVRFLLDDRVYVLEAGQANWATHPWRETIAA